MSTNQDTFGIVALDIMRYVNPSISPVGWLCEKITTGTGTGGTNTLTDSTASWSVDQWAGHYLTFDGTSYAIASNTKTGLTISGTLSGSKAYSIGAVSFRISDNDFQQLVKDACQMVISDIPERYGKLIYKVENEILVDGAYNNQTTASLYYPYKTGTTLELYLNPKIIPAMKSEMLTIDTNFTVSELQDITFTSALGSDSKVYATYEHELPTVPAVLKTLGTWRTVIELFQRDYLIEAELPQFNKLVERYNNLIAQLKSGDGAGISEFDKIVMAVETKGDTATLFGSIEGLR